MASYLKITVEHCQTCGVKIENDRVLFAYGNSGDRDRLFTRVCQYVTGKPNQCINQEGKIRECNRYKDLPPLGDISQPKNQ